MMSTLLLTLLLEAHCHPVEIGSVSLLPVVYVDGSLVSKDPVVALVLKSRVNVDAVNPGGAGTFFVPFALNRLSQSTVCVAKPTVVGVEATTSPSSWKVRSCTAAAGTIMYATAPTTRHGTRRSLIRRSCLRSHGSRTRGLRK